MECIKRLYKLLMSLYIDINSFKYKYIIKLRFPGVNWGENIKVYGKLYLSINNDCKVIIGNNVVFRSDTNYNYVGISKPVSIYVGKGAELSIAENCGFSGTSIYVSTKLTVGSNSIFGGNTSIWDTDFHPINYNVRRNSLVGTIHKEIIIGNDVFIGANSIVLKGICIGSRSIIGAGSVVTKNIPADEIWAGNPTRFIKTLRN